MKTPAFALILVITASVAAAAGEGPSSTPAELRMEAAQRVLQKQSTRYQAYNDLALALVRRARETGDPSYDVQARAAIENSLRLQPDNFEARQAQVNLLLAEHKDRQALEEARALNHRMPDSVLTWGDRVKSFQPSSAISLKQL